MAQQDISQVNQFLRQRLMATGIQQNLPLGVTALTPGQASRVKLQNVGILTRIWCLFTINYTPSVVATPSPFNLLNAITNISLNDFAVQPRINASASGLFIKNSLRNRRKAAAHKPGLAVMNGTTDSYGTPSITLPSVPLAAAANSAYFLLEIPICFDPDAGDLRGAIPMQSNVGEMYLNVTMAGLLGAAGDDTKVFNGAATFSGVTAQVDVLQEYILPQPDAISAKMCGHQYTLPIPPLDCSTVYELATIQSSDSISAGAEKLIALGNTRMINSISYRWFNNSVQGGAGTTNDIIQHRLIVNGASPLKTFLAPAGTASFANWMYAMQREDLGFDLGKGAYVMDFLGLPGCGRQPIQTAQLGNIQIGLTPAANNGGNTFFEFTAESLYSAGSSLGNLFQNG
jgi:hypothetical protein